MLTEFDLGFPREKCIFQPAEKQCIKCINLEQPVLRRLCQAKRWKLRDRNVQKKIIGKAVVRQVLFCLIAKYRTKKNKRKKLSKSDIVQREALKLKCLLESRYVEACVVRILGCSDEMRKLIYLFKREAIGHQP